MNIFKISLFNLHNMNKHDGFVEQLIDVCPSNKLVFTLFEFLEREIVSDYLT